MLYFNINVQRQYMVRYVSFLCSVSEGQEYGGLEAHWSYPRYNMAYNAKHNATIILKAEMSISVRYKCLRCLQGVITHGRVLYSWFLCTCREITGRV